MGAFSAAKYITIKNQGQESAHTCAQLELVGRVHKLLVHNWKWSLLLQELGREQRNKRRLSIFANHCTIVFAQNRQLQPDVYCTQPFLSLSSKIITLV